MTDGRDPFPFSPDDDLGPVSEYRDPALARRFEADPVPDHRPGFWDDLERAIGAGSAWSDEPISISAPVELELRRPPASERRWTSTRWLAVAAAVLAVIGVGGAALVAADRSPSAVESATDLPVTEPSAPDPSPGVDEAASTESTPTTSAVAQEVPTVVSSGDEVDYFGTTRVTGIGRGEAVAFSPDDSAILLVDDAPGIVLGCEGAELLSLFTQDLASGGRRLTLGPGSTIETGGIMFRPAAGVGPSANPSTQTFFWNEYCDGSTLATRRGQLSTDGMLSMVEEVSPDDAAGAFANPAMAGADQAAVTSSDGRFALRVAAGTATVTDLESSRERTLPGEIGPVEVVFGVWSPGSEVVALAGLDEIIIWNHVTDDHTVFDGARADRLLFDNQGRRLALVSLNDVPSTSVLSFGDLPEVSPAAPRCSAAVDLPSLDLDRSSTPGLPTEVIETAVAVDLAAATCDWEALGRLTGDGFVGSFGGDDPITMWQQDEAGFGSPMWTLRMLLRQPFGVSEDVDVPVFAWPELYLRQGCDFDEADLEVLERLGVSPSEAQYQCEALGGYGGYRTGIDRTGSWRFFVTGD